MCKQINTKGLQVVVTFHKLCSDKLDIYVKEKEWTSVLYINTIHVWTCVVSVVQHMYSIRRGTGTTNGTVTSLDILWDCNVNHMIQDRNMCKKTGVYYFVFAQLVHIVFKVN